MNIILHEIKKLWRISTLLVVVVLCGLYFYMYMDWYVRHAQVVTAHDALLTRELAGRYGTRLTHGQMEDFFAERFPELTVELEYHLARDGDFAARGIFTYVDFFRTEREHIHVNDWDEELWQLFNRMYRAENNHIAGRLTNLWQRQDAWSGITFQIGMDLEFERYGFSEWFYATMDKIETAGDVPALLENLRLPLENHADDFIASNPRFTEKGIFTHAQFNDFWEEHTFISFAHDRQRRELWFTLLGPEADFAGRKIGVLDDISGMYTHSYSRTLFDWQMEEWVASYAARIASITPFVQRRIEGIYDNHEYLNIMCWMAFNLTVAYMWRFIVLAVLATLVFVLPLLTVDRMRNLRNVQYTSKTGRAVLYYQATAALISSFILTTLLLVFIGGLYFRETGVLMFWSHPIFSVSNPNIMLFDFTFGQYLLILAAFAYAAALVAALLATVAAFYSRGLIAATIKIIPIFAALVFVLNFVGVNAPFSAHHEFYLRTRIVGGDVYIIAVLLACAAGLILWIFRREKKADLL